jgi:hypothetical protein
VGRELLMVKGTGYGISGYGDQCQFAGAPLSGDGGVIATVQSATAINSDEVKSGVMIRESTGQSAREISLLYTTLRKSPTTTSLTFQSRSTTGGATTTLATVNSINAPVTLRLLRTGNTFTGDYSTDGGRTWTTVGTPQTIPMAGSAQAGLAVGGNQENYHRLARANCDNVTIGHEVPMFGNPATAQSPTASSVPATDESRAHATHQPRTWRDRSGRFSIVATFQSASGGQVKLKREDGSVLSVPLEKLSEADVAYIKLVK